MDISILNPFSVTVLLILLAVATWIDLSEHRIPNGLVLHGLIVGLGMALVAGGPSALGAATAGMLIGGALLLPYYVLGGMGAGDVKLMAMIGVFLGPKLIVAAVLATLLAGVVMGLVYLTGWRIAHSATANRLIGSVRGGFLSHPEPAAADQEKNTQVPPFPYAVSMLIGTAAVLYWHFQLSTGGLS